MAVKFCCDGCGKSIEKPQVRGTVRSCHYCDGCSPVIDAYLKSRDELHTEIANDFRDRLAALKSEYMKLIDGTLPDE